MRKSWTRRDGEKVPESEEIKLGNECVDIDATFLYADLADSTELALQSQDIAAEVVKAYLMGTTRIIRDLGGDIRSFDGDRVMGIFFGERKNNVGRRSRVEDQLFLHVHSHPGVHEFLCDQNIVALAECGRRYEQGDGSAERH